MPKKCRKNAEEMPKKCRKNAEEKSITLCVCFFMKTKNFWKNI